MVKRTFMGKTKKISEYFWFGKERQKGCIQAKHIIHASFSFNMRINY